MAIIIKNLRKKEQKKGNMFKALVSLEMFIPREKMCKVSVRNRF